MTLLETAVAQALAHHRAGRLVEAEAGYRAALAISPHSPAVLHNLGVVLAARGAHDEALSAFDQALAIEPGYATAHYNRGVTLQQQGRTSEALNAYEQSSRLDPGHYDCHRALAFLWLATGDRGRALDHFARTGELRRGDDRNGSALASLTYASRAKLEHDAAQLRHIAAAKRDGKRFALLARAYLEVARDFPATITRLDDDQLDMLGEDYNTAIHIANAPELAGPVIRPTLERDAICSAFERERITSIDDLLSPPALTALRRYVLESTIWHDFAHIGGFVASYLEDGLASPLLLQIVDELRQALPDLLAPHPLTQAWAFKGLAGAAAVEAHADDAAISVNLWLTPDTANLDPSSGGLVVCRAPPPLDWHIAGYDDDKQRIAEFLRRHAADCLAVPYRENRAVLFDSRLFHRSDTPRFAAGYEHHRINLTLLFGRHA